MYPSRFSYHRANSVDEAVRLMSEAGEGGRFLAGGQTVLVLLKMRFYLPVSIVSRAQGTE
jgi:carbon-monoxide dehydrogenase medium subunit